MEREIKFRAFDKICNKIADVEMILFDTKQVKIAYKQFVNNIEVHPLTYYRKFDEVELMQSTGIKDQNGEEIYEKNIEYGLITQFKELNQIILNQINKIKIIETNWQEYFNKENNK